MSIALSVIVPAYNCESYIGEALESVLAGTTSDEEILVVDDGSTDETAVVAEGFAPRVRVIRGPHRGIGATFNRGMSEARGALIGSCDADDRWLPGKLQLQRAALEADPALGAVFGHVRQFLSPEVEDRLRFSISEQPVPGIHRGVMLMRRQAWERVGEMETEFLVIEFGSWYARAVDAGIRRLMLPNVVYERRVHGRNSVLQDRDATHRDYLRMVRATIERRRKGNS
jgi:glycosyltransferase involved in cell wall biosynthesis